MLTGPGAGWGGGFASGQCWGSSGGCRGSVPPHFLVPKRGCEGAGGEHFFSDCFCWTCLTIGGSTIDTGKEGPERKGVKWEAWIGQLQGGGITLQICRKEAWGREAPVTLWVEELSWTEVMGCTPPRLTAHCGVIREQFADCFGGFSLKSLAS